MKYVRYQLTDVQLLKGEAIKWPEEGLGITPHLVTDKMDEGAEGKDKEPVLPSGTVEANPCEGDKDEKEQSMAKYPAIAEEKMSHRFINNVREYRTNKQDPYIYAVA